MSNQARRKLVLGCCLVILLATGASLPNRMFAQTDVTEKSRTRRVSNPASSAPSPTPTPTPAAKEEILQDSDEVVRVETNLTSIFFTAADSSKRFINNLTKEDIRILEDGQTQEIFTFQKNLELPLSIAILIDTSRSEERTLPDEKAAARAFVEAVMRPDKDEAAIVSFTGEVTLEQGFTGNLDRLRRVGGTPPISDTNQMLAGSTAIWDAVWASSNDLLSISADNTRRTIILLTDGENTSGQMKIHEAIERAQKADALIYAVGIGDSYQGGVDEGSLRKITEQTGGRAYFPHNERELRSAFDQIQRDLREQYLVAYSPSNKVRDGSYRRIQIEVVNPELRPQKLKLNYRPGYFAKTADSDLPNRRRPSP